MPAQTLCIGCGQTDDHPRHVITGSQPWHMDCHVLATDCPDCSQQLSRCDTNSSNDGVKGAELRKRLKALRADQTLED